MYKNINMIKGINLVVMYITAPSKEVGRKLSEILVKEKLIACCNMVENVESIYEWKGKVEQDTEVLMIVKSRQDYIDKIVEVVTKNHPYEVPEVIAMPIIGGNKQYMEWVESTTKCP